ncbi:MAG TPA: DUF72 domain-containing protein [Thermoanaerobaculia bacterium]|nr:DUF72 domain-containing protein [Thermoanaerobaculia bacterium]
MIRTGLCGFTIGAAAYFETFDVVEVQQTFYEPPSKLTMDRWRAQAPPGFIFTIKAWQLITHRGTSTTYRRLKSEVNKEEVGAFQLNQTTLHGWKVTRDCARLLSAKAILFQCPASFKPTDENIGNMRRFFAEIGRMKDVDYLWEPRGAAWSDDVVRDLCAELQLVHAVDPFVRPSLTPELLYWRLHGIGNHYHVYTDAQLRQLHAWLPKDANGYVMFNNIPRVGDAKRFITL